MSPDSTVLPTRAETYDVQPTDHAASVDAVVFDYDAEPNTDGASRLGILTVLHTHPDITRKELARLIPALSTDEHMEEN